MKKHSKTAEYGDIVDAAAAPSCSMRIDRGRVTLESPAFAFTLDPNDGLRAVAWENRLTGRMLNMGNGSEVAFDIGLPDQPLSTMRYRELTGIACRQQGDKHAKSL